MDFHLYIHLPGESEKLDQILTAVTNLTAQEKKDMAQLDDEITGLIQVVATDTTVVTSAVTAFNGIPALIANAVQQALAEGATPAQLQAITDVQTSIANNSTALAAAVAAATPAASATPPAAAQALARAVAKK